MFFNSYYKIARLLIFLMLFQVLQYLLDDASEFLKSYNFDINVNYNATEEKGCVNLLKEFVDFISERETENFRVRRHDNNQAVTLTTIHQVHFCLI